MNDSCHHLPKTLCRVSDACIFSDRDGKCLSRRDPNLRRKLGLRKNVRQVWTKNVGRRGIPCNILDGKPETCLSAKNCLVTKNGFPYGLATFPGNRSEYQCAAKKPQKNDILSALLKSVDKGLYMVTHLGRQKKNRTALDFLVMNNASRLLEQANKARRNRGNSATRTTAKGLISARNKLASRSSKWLSTFKKKPTNGNGLMLKACEKHSYHDCPAWSANKKKWAKDRRGLPNIYCEKKLVPYPSCAEPYSKNHPFLEQKVSTRNMYDVALERYLSLRKL